MLDIIKDILSRLDKNDNEINKLRMRINDKDHTNKFVSQD